MPLTAPSVETLTARTVSLRNRLLGFIALPIVLAFLLIGVGASVTAWDEIEEVYDAQLTSLASVLLQLTGHELRDHDGINISLGEEDPNLKHKYGRNTAFRIWDGTQLVAQSRASRAFGTLQVPPGFSNQVVNGEGWRFFMYIDVRDGIRIETSEKLSIRYELIRNLVGSFLLPASLIIPLILLLVWLGVRQSLQPLMALSGAMDARSVDDLSPLAGRDIPREAFPLIAAINRLFGRLTESIGRERDMVDTAAHELRTPLAAMKTQTQVLLRKAGKTKGTAGLRDSLTNLHETIARATRMVEQLLALSRLQQQDFLLEATDMAALVDDVVRDMAPVARQRHVRLLWAKPEAAVRPLHADSVRVLVHNVIDNALKYTPAGGEVRVDVAPDGGLAVTDTGPGLSEADKRRVFDRFVRVDKTGQPGSGLGLAIVQWVAQGHGARVVLDDALPHGLRVRVAWA